jgi:hypothetical protein
MGRIIRNLKSTSGALLGMTIMLIAIFFVLNFIASRGLGPVSSAAQWAESHANGTAYAGGAPVVGVPSTSVGINANGPAL